MQKMQAAFSILNVKILLRVGKVNVHDYFSFKLIYLLV